MSSPPRLVPTTAPQHGVRSHTCGDLRMDHVGQTVTLKGWADTVRNMGGLEFVDLRDRYGLTQLVFSPEHAAAPAGVAAKLRSEDVLSIVGTVRERQQKNPSMTTGDVEVFVDDVEVLNVAEPLPFVISAREERQQNTADELRMQYRYLDLRRPALQRNLILRHRLYQATRKYFDAHDFVEIETPILMKSTPEGARDYLVPSRVHPGSFYALPQSPQTYKQILMVAGLDRYVQITKCFRDEDLRADRQPEFTQIDVEMTFATEEAVYELIEGLIAAVWQETRGIVIETPFPRMSFADAIRRYGSDKPDLRFGMELVDLSDAVRDSGFRVFDEALRGGAVVGFVVEGEAARGRGAMDRLDKEIVRQKIGAGGLFYVRVPEDGPAVASVKEEVLPRQIVDRMVADAGARPGDLLLVLAGPAPRVFEQAGTLRLHVAGEQGLIPAGANLGGERGANGPWRFLWVTEFPLFEYSEEDRRLYAMHHPFTSPKPEDLPLLDEDPGAARARAYDLVLNGTELGGGSIRIHQREVQSRMFEVLGIDAEEAQRRFGFILDAFRYGAPPHGGIALGLDRMVMLLAGAPSLREVIAFPKTQAATEPMSGAPDEVDAAQLRDLGIRLG